MPYIKHRGAPPSTIKESVCFADRNAPCYEGVAALSAAARRFSESAFPEGPERAKAFKEFFETHTYQGLQHIGGVGVVEDNAVRAQDEAITKQEYEQLSAEIKNANDAYYKQKAELLAKNNDPLRRGYPEHETLRWRTRAWVASYTELDHHIPYSIGGKCFAYLRVRKHDESGMTFQLLDIYHNDGVDIEQALFEGTDWAAMGQPLLLRS